MTTATLRSYVCTLYSSNSLSTVHWAHSSSDPGSTRTRMVELAPSYLIIVVLLSLWNICFVESSSESAQQCRLAFYGPIRDALKENESVRLYVMKVKECVIHKVSDWRPDPAASETGGAEKGLAIEAIVKNLVGEKGSVTAFLGMKVETEAADYGTIVSAFGSGG